MRKKPNLIPRIERASAVLCTEPESFSGKWLEKFPACRELHVEIGCGKGGFTADMAQLHPDILFLAIEKVPDAMIIAMERVLERGLQNVRFIDRDIINCASVFSPGEVSRIYINFPDPWPKKRQYKRRLTAAPFLDIYKTLLRPGGQIWFKTDQAALFEWSLEQFSAKGWALREITRDLHETGLKAVLTDYESKFVEQGIKINRCVAGRE